MARRLVEENILDADAAFKASEEARKQGTPFVTYLVQTGLAEAPPAQRIAPGHEDC